jgi:5-methylcytosine-specific restriction endonuclease McrA
MTITESERKEIYDQMSKNEQFIVDNFFDDDLNYERWSNELDLLNCYGEHEFEYRYHYSENKVLQLFTQCTECGKRGEAGGSLKHSNVENFKEKVKLGQIPKYDIELLNKKSATYEKFSKFNKLIWSKKQSNSKQEWFKQHNEYLQTDQWKAIRLKVLKRDNFLCQACLDAPATEVHHLTYNHWKFELMFELLSVCSNCHHNRIHIK